MAQITLRSGIKVEYIDHMGSDQRCVEAMLVSSRGTLTTVAASQSGVEGRLKALITRRHGTPFECGSLTVMVECPIKVLREWHRHRVGWSYSEASARYKQLEPVFWIPPRDRPLIKVDGFKPMSPEFRPPTGQEYTDVCRDLADGYRLCYTLYEHLLNVGTDPGLARDVLGVGIFTSMYATCNPRSLMHFLELRTNVPTARRPSSPLWEIAEAARQLEAIFAQYWPITHRLWNENGRMAP